MPLAHVLTAGSGPGPIAWLPAGVAIAAIVVFAFGPRRLRRASAVLAATGLGTVLLLDVLAPSPPAPPGYALVVLPTAGSHVTSPFAVAACGRSGSGASVLAPGGDRVLSVALDGREVASTTASSLLLSAPQGFHRLRVEVLTRDHVEYQPPLFAEVQIVVTGPAAAATPPPCG